MMKRKDRIDRAVETIRGYCSKVPRCEKCRFVTPDGGCPFNQEIPPCDWSMDVRQQPEADK